MVDCNAASVRPRVMIPDVQKPYCSRTRFALGSKRAVSESSSWSGRPVRARARRLAILRTFSAMIAAYIWPIVRARQASRYSWIWSATGWWFVRRPDLVVRVKGSNVGDCRLGFRTNGLNICWRLTPSGVHRSCSASRPIRNEVHWEARGLWASSSIGWPPMKRSAI